MPYSVLVARLHVLWEAARYCLRVVGGSNFELTVMVVTMGGSAFAIIERHCCADGSATYIMEEDYAIQR